MIQKILGYSVYLFVFIALWILLYLYTSFGFQPVEGNEMMPLLKAETHKILSIPSPGISSYRVNDIVMYEYVSGLRERKPRQTWVGRIIALPGDRVRIEKGEIFVNGTRIAQDYVVPNARSEETLEEIVVPRDSVYIAHDNRVFGTSHKTFGFHDSRSAGPIGIWCIKGKIW